MAETLRIEIPIETVDNTDPELSNITKGFEKMEKSADEAASAAKKAGTTVSQFDKNAEKTEKTLASWAKEKYQIMLEAKDKISPILSTLGSGLKTFAGKTWSVTMKAIDLVTSPVRGIINLLKNPIFQVGAVLGISIGLQDTIETYENFEAAMSEVQAISGATSSDLEKLTAKAREMGAETKFTAEESAEAMNYMAMAGWKTEDMLNGIEGILSLAAASGEDLATTSDIVTDALTAFNMSASDAGHFSDVLAQAASNSNTTVSGMGETFKYAGSMAGALGYSIEDVALATGLMANSGIKGTMAGTALNSIFTRLSTNTSGAADAIKELGIDFYNSEGNARDLSDVLGELREATANMNNEQKTSLANTIAGTEAQKGLLAILNASEEDYNKLSDAINNADGAAANMADTMMDNLQGSIELLQSAADEVKLSFGERLSPYVRSLADWLTEQMPEIEDGLDEMMDWVDVKVESMQRKFQELTQTQEWQDADFFGKVKIAWDEIVAEPFVEWWNSTGKVKFSGYAKDIGRGIGTGLKAGILTLLGIDVAETVDEGASIGASFAKGFSEGFDFEAVSEKLLAALGNVFSSAADLLPGGDSASLSSVLSAALLARVAVPLTKGAVTVGKGVKTLFGTNAETGTSLVGSLMGSTGNAMVGGSGILGGLANVGYAVSGGSKAGMYFGSMAGTMSGGMAALAGAGTIAGTVAGAASAISGAVDAYKAVKSDDSDYKKAYGTSAATKLGGVAAGAVIGTMILPGLGTAIGAGIGGIAGWIAGNKVKEKYEENVEQQERLQQISELTGISADNATFKNKELQEALNDSEVSAEEFAQKFQEECANVADEAFGDITLSLEEVKSLASEITFADQAEELTEFSQAVSDADAALNTLESSVSALKKENWKVGLGMELSETDADSYKSTVDDFVESAQAYVSDNHYEVTTALKLLVGDGADTSGIDSYYTGLETQLSDLGTQLTDSVDIALQDSVITLDESAEIESLQEQITEITGKLSEAQSEAELETLKIKYNGAALDTESFDSMQDELATYVSEASEQYESALTLTLTSLKLQLSDGAITQEEYDDAVAEATDGYYAQIDEMDLRVRDFNLSAISEAWGSSLDGILPDIEGTTQEKLTTAMNNALLIEPDVEKWTADDVIGWFGLDQIDLDSVEQTDIASEIIKTALAVPEGTKEEIVQEFQSALPTAEDLMNGIDWESMTYEMENQMMSAFFPTDGTVLTNVGESYDASALISDSVNFDTLKENLSERLATALEECEDTETVKTWLETYYTSATEQLSELDLAGTLTEGFSTQLASVDFSSVMEQYGPISDEYYSTLLSEWETAGTEMGTSLNDAASTSLSSAGSQLRTSAESAITSAFSNPFSVTAKINVTGSYNLLNTFNASTSTSSSSKSTKSATKHATGGYVGSPELALLAEEGYGEYVIPTAPGRRSRALELYREAGAALGVSAYAEGGFAGGSNSALSGGGYNFLAGVERSAGSSYGETTGADVAEDTSASTYAGAGGYVGSPETGASGGTPQVEVNVSLAPEFVIKGGDGQSEDGIMEVIKRHLKEIADELGGEIAENLSEVFSNMPLKEA